MTLKQTGLRVRGLTAEPSYTDAHDPEKQINDNLDEMVHSITRLKGIISVFYNVLYKSK